MQQERSCAAAHVSIRVQAAQAADVPQPPGDAAAGLHAAPDQAARLHRLASGAQAGGSQQQHTQSQSWKDAWWQAHAAQGGAAPKPDAAAAAERLQQARYQLPLTAAQTQSLALQLQGLPLAPQVPQHAAAAAQNPCACKPYTYQALNVADWQPQRQSSTQVAAQALGSVSGVLRVLHLMAALLAL